MICVIHLDHGFLGVQGAVAPLGMLVVLPYDLGTQNGLQAIFNGNIPGCGDFVNCFLLFLLAIREAITADTALPTTVDTAAVRAAVTNALYIGLTPCRALISARYAARCRRIGAYSSSDSAPSVYFRQR